MSKEISRSNQQTQLIHGEALKALRDIEDKIRDKHETVSKKETNSNHVKQKAGMDYVEFAYMKSQANKYYPGWSFKNLTIESEFLPSGWVVVSGELHWIDEGMPRVGACAAAHRIAFKSGLEKTMQNIVDLGNDVKAAVTDAMKKGFNTYMNISDDIYRHLEVENLSNDQIKALYDIIEQCPHDKQKAFYNFVDLKTNSTNVDSIAKRLLKAMAKTIMEETGEEEAEKEYQKHKTILKELGINVD